MRYCHRLHEVSDFVGVAGFLVAELVAGEGEDREAARSRYLQVEGFEAGVYMGGESRSGSATADMMRRTWSR